MMKKIYTEKDIKRSRVNVRHSGDVDITRSGFEDNLVLAAQRAVEFARTLVVNILPGRIKYVVYLGASYDNNPLESEEVIFPEDHDMQRLVFENGEEVVDLLWRDGKVPEWIDVSVESEDGEVTSVQLICCGRFSDDVTFMYHAHEGHAPFHVLGPPTPPEYGADGKSEKYDLHWNKKK